MVLVEMEHKPHQKIASGLEDAERVGVGVGVDVEVGVGVRVDTQEARACHTKQDYSAKLDRQVHTITPLACSVSY